MNIIVFINIYIVDSIKEELLIELNQFAKYKANLIFMKNKIRF